MNPRQSVRRTECGPVGGRPGSGPAPGGPAAEGGSAGEPAPGRPKKKPPAGGSGRKVNDCGAGIEQIPALFSCFPGSKGIEYSQKAERDGEKNGVSAGRRDRGFRGTEMPGGEPRAEDRPGGLPLLRKGLPDLSQRPDLQLLPAAGRDRRHGHGSGLSSEYAVFHVLMGQSEAFQIHERPDHGLPAGPFGGAAHPAVQGRAGHPRGADARLGILPAEDQLRHALRGQRGPAGLRLGGLPVPVALRLCLRGKALSVLLFRRPVRGPGKAAQAHALHSFSAGRVGGGALCGGPRRRQQHAAHGRLLLPIGDGGAVYHGLYAGPERKRRPRRPHRGAAALHHPRRKSAV